MSPGRETSHDHRPVRPPVCKDGPLAPELGRALNEAQELRIEGDYGAATADVATYIETAETFVAAVKRIISGAAQG